jgi:hypothetical protein
MSVEHLQRRLHVELHHLAVICNRRRCFASSLSSLSHVLAPTLSRCRRNTERPDLYWQVSGILGWCMKMKTLISVSLCAAQSDETKQKNGITHILSVCPESTSTGPNRLVISVDDSEYADLLIHLPDACRFIEDALTHGGRILIHCVMGVSRSATVRTC